MTSSQATACLTRVLSESDVRAVLTPDRCLQLQREVLRTKARLTSPEGIRSGFKLPNAGLRVSVIAGSGLEEDSAGCKIISSSAANRSRGLPTAMSVYVLHEVPTGRVAAVVSSTYLTNLRTGATAALAALTLRTSDERRLGILGTGPVAACVVTALASQEAGWEVLSYSPRRDHREAFVAAFADRSDVEVRAVDDPRVVAGRPILVTATDGRGAAVEGGWLADTRTVISVASRATVSEIPHEAVAGRHLVVDDRAAALSDAAEFATLDSAQSLLELGEILAGEVDGRGSDEEFWFFKSTGLPAQDVATVTAVVGGARGLGLGIDVALGF